MNLKSRSEARAAGLTRYFTGKPCKHGHIAERSVSNKCCTVCRVLITAKYDKNNVIKTRTRHRKAKIKWLKTAKGRKAHLAHVMVNQAIAKGRLTKKPCKICGNQTVEAHHPDYAKPLDVVWLCKKHHDRITHATKQC